jgi:hypothetical protein
MSPGGKGHSSRKRRRCIRVIGEERTKIAKQVLAQAIHCQRVIDRTATSFGLISPTCLGAARKAGPRSRAIARACAGFAGPDIGSCGPLPDCVIASATQTGHDLAVATYGFRPEQQGQLCGNGVIDTGETCDDGAANGPTAACTDKCQKARCGDGVVEAGVEQCDPGSQPMSSSPITNDPDCNSDCKLTTCGDGVIQTGGSRPDEQCDDGDKNGAPGDQCTSSCQFVTVSCPAGATVDVTVTFVATPMTYTSDYISGFDVTVGYPPSLSFPGSQFLPVEDPSDPASRLILLGGPFNLYDGTLVNFFDSDTSIRTIVSGAATNLVKFSSQDTDPAHQVPFERIRFDCISDGELTAGTFPCTRKIVNKLGQPLPPNELPDCRITLSR